MSYSTKTAAVAPSTMLSQKSFDFEQDEKIIMKKMKATPYQKNILNCWDIKEQFDNISGLAMFRSEERFFCYVVLFTLLYFCMHSLLKL
ncbi:hypothetical protein DFA_09606 [Cavenderia fasciculata]|uniref:Uncharacterized protein n=1 Tax=Cavenderia fasciculata TaxID=261658 RepID=F4Q835_CACFS|nr:uncharacterized protein DFA_09606 [Cavenderia fasciculata]EGG15935.1 hypothetical protein DFA_09606 [Cavenderia fasciculata]|eukprot:XP_004352260.1 hypothetical protein DFA_09606 [Cavenderia fasciculata]